MRISDWSSDVCSSDLPYTIMLGIPANTRIAAHMHDRVATIVVETWNFSYGLVAAASPLFTPNPRRRPKRLLRSEERRVGKGVSVRVDLGGRRIIEKKNKQETD